MDCLQGFRFYEKYKPRDTGSLYTKAGNLSDRLQEGWRGIDALREGAICSVTVKLDGTQLWLRWQLKDDGSLKLVFIKSHGGNTQGAKISPDGWETPQAVFNSSLTFQGGNIHRTLGDPALWEAIKAMMTEIGVTEMDCYCEHTFTSDKKTPCGLDYSSESHLYDRLFIFEFVWMKDGDKYAISHTQESCQNPWWKMIFPWMIPLVDSLSGRPLTLETLTDIYTWLEEHSHHEGLMLLVGDHITKIKLHHAKDLLPKMEKTNEWLPTDEELPMKEFLLKIYQLFLKTLAKNNVNLKNPDDIVPRVKKERTHKQAPAGGWIEFDEGKAKEEINKALTHEDWSHLFNALREIGEIKTRDAHDKFYSVLGQTKITHKGGEINLINLVFEGLLDDYNKGVEVPRTLKNFSKGYKADLNDLLVKIVREKLREQCKQF